MRTDSGELDAASVAALAAERMFGLEGRVALVTGAGGGLGRWLAAGLAAAGASVAAADVTEETADAVAGPLRGLGHDVHAFGADLADPDVPDRLTEAVTGRFGRLDVLVNGAAVNRREPADAVTGATWDRLMAVDLRAPYFLARAAARPMRAQGGGSIVHVGSINIAMGLEGVSVYGAAKAGLAQLARSQSVEWLRYGIRVNCLAPGFMLSPLSEELWKEPERGGWLRDRSPLRRPGTPQELVGALLLLAGDAGSFISGQTLFVDGGVLAGTPWSRASEHERQEGEE